MAKKRRKRSLQVPPAGYDVLLADIGSVIEEARRSAARSVNAVMTATYWLVGRRIVEQEQRGQARAGYGEALLERLGADLTIRFGRGFSVDNLETMRAFFVAYPPAAISETPSRKSLATRKPETASRKSLVELAERFRLSWSHYVLLLRTGTGDARAFYETEALRGGWTVRQLRRQIDSQFYEHTALSRNEGAMLSQGAVARPEDVISPEEQIKDPYVVEFLALKDEYSEADLEEALIRHLETFLLDPGRREREDAPRDRGASERSKPMKARARTARDRVAAIRISKARLEEMTEQAIVDAYGESEQVTGWFTMIDEHLAVPFATTVLGRPVTVARVDLNASEQIVAICSSGRNRQALAILDLPMPTPPPKGAEWIEAYRRWRRGG